MSQIKNYHRPKSTTETLHLLNRSDINTVLIAGGTYLTPNMSSEVEELVDLQSVGLGSIDRHDGQIGIGAMTRLQSLVDHIDLPTLVREMAQREGPNTMRSQATIGGVIVGGDWESELLAALLVYEATVTLEGTDETRSMSLTDFLADSASALKGQLLTQVSFPAHGKTAAERVARTPADKPIVAALVRLEPETQYIHVALCGVADTPILVSQEELVTLNPPADFRGSTEYRKEMAQVLTTRAISSLKKK
ncbi:FAD binding domain-containing protein [Anaerolineales bacterium HSG25]|nr:FAD binding domain-containing protein [Anaerolineales bacterium HSG25]